MTVRILIPFVFVVLLSACWGAEEFDRTMNNPDENYMSDVARGLDAAGVDFRVLRDGSIAYRSRDAHTLKSIEDRLKNDPAARASSKK